MATALITGASAGLGKEFAKLFAEDQHDVLLVARRKNELENLKVELQEKWKIQVHILDLDISKPDSAKKILHFVENNQMEIEFLVNNAGFGTNGTFAELELERELQMIDLNIRSLVELTYLFMQPMIARKHGKILNIGSVAGFQAGPFMSTYYASKAFVNSFSEALSIELKGSGVTCTVLAPGPTATEFQAVAKLEKRKVFNADVSATAISVAKCGYQGMMSGQSLVVPGLSNKLIVQSGRFLPRQFLQKAVAKMNKN